MPNSVAYLIAVSTSVPTLIFKVPSSDIDKVIEPVPRVMETIPPPEIARTSQALLLPLLKFLITSFPPPSEYQKTS